MKIRPVRAELFRADGRAFGQTDRQKDGWTGRGTDLIYNMFLLTAIGLTPGGSSTVHIYTQTIHRTTQNQQCIEQHKNFGGCGPCSVLARLDEAKIRFSQFLRMRLKFFSLFPKIYILHLLTTRYKTKVLFHFT